jgi:hypothetical protein
MAQKFLRGYLCLGQSEFECILKYDKDLFDYLCSGRNIKIKNVVEMEFLKEADENGI